MPELACLASISSTSACPGSVDILGKLPSCRSVILSHAGVRLAKNQSSPRCR